MTRRGEQPWAEQRETQGRARFAYLVREAAAHHGERLV